jgi:hypothetical protein
VAECRVHAAQSPALWVRYAPAVRAYARAGGAGAEPPLGGPSCVRERCGVLWVVTLAHWWLSAAELSVGRVARVEATS